MEPTFGKSAMSHLCSLPIVPLSSGDLRTPPHPATGSRPLLETEGGNTEGGAQGQRGDSAMSLGSQRRNLGSTELSYHKGTGGKGSAERSWGLSGRGVQCLTGERN